MHININLRPQYSFRNVLNNASHHINKFTEDGKRKVIYRSDEINNEIIECSKEIGKLEMYISEHKNYNEYELLKNELEEVLEKLRMLL